MIDGASRVVLMVKNLPANVGDLREAGSIPRSGRSPGGGHGNPPQYSCLENPMHRGAWRATVHGVAKSWTRLKRLGTQHIVDLQYLVSFRCTAPESKVSQESDTT